MSDEEIEHRVECYKSYHMDKEMQMYEYVGLTKQEMVTWLIEREFSGRTRRV